METVLEHVLAYKKANPGSVAWRLPKHCEIVEKHLNVGEQIIFAFMGQKNDKWYDLFTTCVVVLTNKRIIVAQKRVVWGYFLKSITPEMYNDLNVYSGLIWGKVTIDTIKETVVLSNVSKLGLDDIETNVAHHMAMGKKKSNKKQETV